jgi:ribonuclease HI
MFSFNKTSKIAPTLEYLLRFDGCSKGNPGKGGCGAVIYHNGTETWAGRKYVGERVTNNYAEYSGLILGLEKALELNIKALTVQGDSLLVIQQMNNIYKCNSPNLIELYTYAIELTSKFDIIQFKHIYRNNNTRADQLSNIGLKLDFTCN